MLFSFLNATKVCADFYVHLDNKDENEHKHDGVNKERGVEFYFRRLAFGLFILSLICP